jgi:S-DNA-T family DNA segregation ATPase FtsK/SpoIIIE
LAWAPHWHTYYTQREAAVSTELVQPGGELETNASSFDIVLDEETPAGPPVFVDTAPEPVKLPIIPAHLRTMTGVKKATVTAVGRAAYRVAGHGVRSPMYLWWAACWSIVGVFRLLGRQLRWWWHPELSSMLQHAASKNDLDHGAKLHKQISAARQSRGLWLGLELLGLVLAALLLAFAAPRWVLLLVALALIPVLAHYGRPIDRPIIKPVLLTPRHRRLNLDIVQRAYYRAKLGDPDKDGQEVTFPYQMARDSLNAGSQVVVDLAHGRTFSEAMAAREKLASGLDVTVSQVYLSPDKSSNRRHLLWVADVDPLSIPAGRTPLLDCRPRDIWKAAPLGLDERGRRVLLPLMFTSVLIGAQPRKGKTFTARSLALFAALDPYTRISVFDASGKPDWRSFAMIAYTYGFGLLPDRVQGNPLETLLATLRAAKKEVQERNVKLSELPTSVCPEGKLTREIARNPRYGMPVWLIFLEEFQEYINTGAVELDEKISDLLVFLVKVGPAAGLILVSSTQKPSGLGSSGKVAKRFTDYRDQHQTRFALKTGSYQVSDAVLGAGAYSEGYDSSALPVGDEYRGVGILYDAPVPNATVRTYLADSQDAEKILTAARAMRQRLDLLDGMAAGQEVAIQARDPLADSLDALHDGEAWISWTQLAARLAEQSPDKYADTTPQALSNTLTGLGLSIESKNGRDLFDLNDKGEGRVVKGVHRAALQRAIERRSSE